MNELVSIITPVYNSENYISKTIISVLKQTYQNWELILIDDCSSDNSINIIEDYIKNDKRIRLLKLLSNQGAGFARNKGIENANGQFIAFLDSDDSWLPEKLEKQVNFMLRNDISFSFTAYEQIYENKISIKINVPSKINYNKLLKKNIIGCLTAMYNAKKIGKVYMPLIRKRQDWVLWLTILKKVEYAYGINEILAVYNVRSKTISSNKLKLLSSQWIVYRKFAHISVIKSFWFIFCYYGQGFFHQFKKIFLLITVKNKN